MILKLFGLGEKERLIKKFIQNFGQKFPQDLSNGYMTYTVAFLMFYLLIKECNILENMMVLKLTRSTYLLLIATILLFISCTKEINHYKLEKVKVLMNRELPTPDQLIYFVNPYIGKIDEVEYIEVIDHEGNVLEKRRSFKPYYEDTTAIKFTTTKFIDSYNNSLMLENLLSKGKLRVVYKDGNVRLYESEE
ncbi:hypothetical protein [Zunongwangia profunda]